MITKLKKLSSHGYVMLPPGTIPNSWSSSVGRKKAKCSKDRHWAFFISHLSFEGNCGHILHVACFRAYTCVIRNTSCHLHSADVPP